jgi:hypothetical protein
MEESVTYQAIIRKGVARGEIEEARRLVLRAGEKKFGPPDAAVRAAVDRIADRDQLEGLLIRVFDVDSWQALLQVSS